MSDEEKPVWERGKDALETLLQHFNVSDIELLAAKVKEKPELVQVLSHYLKQL